MRALKISIIVFFLCTMCFNFNVSAYQEIKIAFVGLFGSGKTSLREIAANEYFNFENRKPTRAANEYVKNLRYFDEDIKCTLIDTSGDETVKNAIITHRLKDVDIAVLTIDSSENQFGSIFKQNFVEWISSINKVHPNIPIILAATKIDNGVNINDLHEQMKSLRDAYKWTGDFECVMVSAKQNKNIGSLLLCNDVGENFWGRIRYIIKERNIINNKPLNQKEVVFHDNEQDDPDKTDGKCTLL